MIYDIVVINITRACNASCSLCCLSCNPTRTEMLEDEIIEKVIIRLKDYRQVKCISVTGGEPMLYPEKVMKIADLVEKSNKEFVIFTNGYWCNSDDETLNILMQLKKKGLTKILTSVDTFHQKFVSIENVSRLVRICRSLGINVNIHSSIINSNLFKTDMLLQQLGQNKLGANIAQSPVIPIGRASTLPPDEIIRQIRPCNIHCSFDRMCRVNWDGDVYPCCSQVEIKQLILGNIYKDDIVSIINNVRKSLFLVLILKYGLNKLAYLAESLGILKLKEYYADSCEVCRQIFANEEVINELMLIAERVL